jgi:hypothetical protein
VSLHARRSHVSTHATRAPATAHGLAGAAVHTTVPAWTPAARLYELVADASGLAPGADFLLAGRLSDGRTIELPRQTESVAGSGGSGSDGSSPLFALSPSTYMSEVVAVGLDAARVAAEAAAHAAALAAATASGLATTTTPPLPPQFVYFDAALGACHACAAREGI